MGDYVPGKPHLEQDLRERARRKPQALARGALGWSLEPFSNGRPRKMIVASVRGRMARAVRDDHREVQNPAYGKLCVS